MESEREKEGRVNLSNTETEEGQMEKGTRMRR